MFAKVTSAGVRGLSGFTVTGEADLSQGLPALTLVGLPDSAVKETGDRVRSALKNLGYLPQLHGRQFHANARFPSSHWAHCELSQHRFHCDSYW